MVPADVRRRFEGTAPYLEWVAETARDTVRAFCDSRGYAYVGRTKTLESLAEKIETGRFQKWSELDDLFGCAVVVPTLADEAGVLEFLKGKFNEVGVKRRGATRKHPESFRFEATRFNGRLSPTGPADPQDPPFQITFEVQIRTAFEHAWSVTTHAIYKSGKVSWKAKRLAAQLKAAVEQLDSLGRVDD